MKKQLFISAIGQPMFYAQSTHEKSDGAFLVVTLCLAIIEAIAQVTKFFG